jgi:hypothetical protein
VSSEKHGKPSLGSVKDADLLPHKAAKVEIALL